VSEDNGKTWKQVQRNDIDHLMGLQLPNGDLLRFENQPSLPLEGLQLPEPICTSVKGFAAYPIDQLPDGLCKKTWEFVRVNAAHPEGILEKATLNWPYMFTTAAKGVLIQPHPAGRLRLAPDGTLWMPHYATVGIDPDTGKVTMESSFLFDIESSKLSAEGKAYLDGFLDVYSAIILSDAYSGYISKIIIEGHTDTDGSYSYNQTLSEQRANSVAEHCIARNPLLADVIETEGCSYDYPVYNKDGSVNMAKSRRVTFRFTLTVD
jgi:outer membrane protein OmpA-like peptidoglycan-associated protein